MNRGGNNSGGGVVGPSFPPVKAGSLRRKLTIQSRAATSNGALGVTGAWSDVLTTWGSVTAKQTTALLALIAGQQMPRTVYDVIIRYPPTLAASILPGMRIVDGPRAYLINNVNDTDERHRILHLACVQEPAAP